MSRHEGVSCDSCLKGNFRGKRYKCLICYDYDLCATCYEAGATTTRHTTDHPMQCILTRSDFDLYYGGEAISVDQPQAYTCPFCGKTGFTETTLHDHVTSEHPDTSFEVVCPVCAALPGGEPNNVTDDFAAHLTLEHRSPRDLDDSSSSRQVRRIPHPGRGMSTARARRSQMQFSSSSGLSSLSPSSRESMDPIAELLSQLSGVRRTSNLAQSTTASTTTTQLQQLQMQLQLERQQAQAARQQLDRFPRRQSQIGSGMVASNSGASTGGAVTGSSGAVLSHCTIVLEPTPSPAVASASSQFLLSRCMDPSLSESEQQNVEIESADRSLFVQELLLTSLAEQFANNPDWDVMGKKLGLHINNELNEFSCLQAAAIAGVSQDETCEEISNPLQQENVQSSSASQQNTLASQPQQTLGQASQINQQQLRSSGTTRRSPNLGSSSLRQPARRGGGGTGSGASSQMSGNSQSYRVGASSHLQQVPTRDGLSSSRNRSTTGRDSGTSPSSTRRKVVRQVDDRNKSSEPPPPH